MKSLSQYIAEALIDEAFVAYYRHNRVSKQEAEKFNFNLIGGDHAAERGSERWLHGSIDLEASLKC